MQRKLLAAILALFAASPASPEAARPHYAPLPEYRTYGAPAAEGDASAISDVLRRLSSAWADQDVDAVVSAYAEDAEWVNAFGMVFRGHSELRERFTALFQRFPATRSADTAEETDSTSDDPPKNRISLRYVGSEAAVVHTFTESDWGPGRDGSAIRRVMITYVLGKRDGSWKVVHEMIMDARPPPGLENL